MVDASYRLLACLTLLGAWNVCAQKSSAHDGGEPSIVTPPNMDEAALQYMFDDTLRSKVVLYDSVRALPKLPPGTEELEVVSKSGRPFVCHIPDVLAEPDSEKGKKKKRKEAALTPVELMSALATENGARSCIENVIGYWTYKYCHREELSQFHVQNPVEGAEAAGNEGSSSGPKKADGAAEEETSKNVGPKSGKKHKVGKYVLGVYDGSQGVEELKTPPPTMWHQEREVPYYEEYLRGGTLCDLTGKPRETAVRFVCNRAAGRGELMSIVEGPTCVYQVVIESALLCKHPDYKIRSSQEVTTINCKAQLLPGEERGDDVVRTKQRNAEDVVTIEEVVSQVMDAMKDGDFTLENIAAALEDVTDIKPLTIHSGGEKGSTVGKVEGLARAEMELMQIRAAKGYQDVPLPLSLSASIEVLNKECIILKASRDQYWRYELCLGKGTLTQYHDETRINMGVYTKESHDKAWKSLSSFEKNRILRITPMVYLFEGGDYCKDADENRQSKIFLICDTGVSGGDLVLDLSEPDTCTYVVKLKSKSFCEEEE